MQSTHFRHWSSGAWARLVQFRRCAAADSLGEPVAREPVARESVAREPVARESVAREPVAREPVARKPVACGPVACKPVACEPVASEPVLVSCGGSQVIKAEPTAGGAGINLSADRQVIWIVVYCGILLVAKLCQLLRCIAAWLLLSCASCKRAES